MSKLRSGMSKFISLLPAAVAGDVVVRNPELFLSARQSMYELVESVHSDN